MVQGTAEAIRRAIQVCQRATAAAFVGRAPVVTAPARNSAVGFALCVMG